MRNKRFTKIKLTKSMAIGCTTLDQTIEVIVRLAISIAFNSHVNTTNDQKQQWNSHANARQNCKNH